MPVFERADYLVEALRSIERQTRPPEEVIIVVDGPGRPHRSARRGRRRHACARPSSGRSGRRGEHGVRGRVAPCSPSSTPTTSGSPTLKLERQLEALADDPDLEPAFASVEQFYSPELGRAGGPSRDAGAERSGCSRAPWWSGPRSVPAGGSLPGGSDVRRSRSSGTAVGWTWGCEWRTSTRCSCAGACTSATQAYGSGRPGATT